MGFTASPSLLRSLLASALFAAGCGESDGAPDEGTAAPGDSTDDPSTATPTESATESEPESTGDIPAETGEGTTGVDEDVVVVPLRAGAFSVPSIETYYACFEFSFELDQLGHIVGFDPEIDDAAHVHHFVLSKLDGPTGQTDGYSCFDLEGELLYTWAPGGQGWNLPPEAGFLIGDAEGGNVTLRLQVHYDNPAGDVGVTDSSGVDLRVARTLRPHNAGTMVFGDIENISIPPGMAEYEHVATCSGQATAALLDEPMHIFGTSMHAHDIGSVLWSEVHRDGAMLYEMNRDDPYLFDSQHMKPVDEIVEPGDEIRTHCIYDSTSRTQTTIGGPGTTNEMCWNVVTYWPRVSQPIDTCGSYN